MNTQIDLSCFDFEVRTDELKQCGYKILQSPKKFCFGIDAVLLADFAASSIKNGCEVVDLCTGTGIVPLLLCGKNSSAHYSALEIQKESALMAKKSVELNGLQDKINIIEEDIKNVQTIFKNNSAAVVTCNPPYMIAEHGKQNPNDFKAIARHEIFCTLEDVVKAAGYLLPSEGHFFMIHRPFRLSEIFVTLNKYKLEAKRMRLIHPHAAEEPNMVLIEAVKGAKPFLTVEKPLVVRNEDGSYTEEINRIYSW